MNHTHKLIKVIAGEALIAAGFVMAVFATPNAAEGNEGKTIYSFTGGYSSGPDGAFPAGDLIRDAMGNFYGVTSGGGGSSNCSLGCGTVYKVAGGQESVLYAFTGGNDGSYPADGLLLDDEGNLYGVTGSGGASDLGTVFKLAPDGTKTILYSFAGGSADGAGPNGDLIADAEGNLYGTTYSGGIGLCTGGCGTVFKITPDGQESILYAFRGGGSGMDDDGARPSAGLVADSEGNFYGPTYGGGKLPGCPGGCGTIFKITPDGQESMVFAFEGGKQGGHPSDRLLLDANEGYLYGTAPRGGDGTKEFGCVFKVGLDGTERVLYSFKHHEDGLAPSSGLIADSRGDLYGTVFYGGASVSGLVYRVTQHGRFEVLYDFPGTFDGNFPIGRLIMDPKGNLYGTCYRGGENDAGTIFKVQN